MLNFFLGVNSFFQKHQRRRGEMSAIISIQIVMISIIVLASILFAVAIYYKTRSHGNDFDKYDEDDLKYFRTFSFMVLSGVIFFYSPVFILGIEGGMLALDWEFYGLSFGGCFIMLICQTLILRNIWQIKQRMDFPLKSLPPNVPVFSSIF